MNAECIEINCFIWWDGRSERITFFGWPLGFQSEKMAELSAKEEYMWFDVIINKQNIKISKINVTINIPYLNYIRHSNNN